MRFITIDETGKVSGVRFGMSKVGNEIESEIGEIGQLMTDDGSFIDIEEPERIYPPTQEDEILFETKYQTLLIETILLGGIN